MKNRFNKLTGLDKKNIKLTMTRELPQASTTTLEPALSFAPSSTVEPPDCESSDPEEDLSQFDRLEDIDEKKELKFDKAILKDSLKIIVTDVQVIQYFLVKSLFSKVFFDEISIPEFKVSDMFSLNNAGGANSIEFFYSESFQCKLPNVSSIIYECSYKDNNYYFFIESFTDSNDKVHCFLKCRSIGVVKESTEVFQNTKEFYKFIIEKSIQHSPWKNKIIRIAASDNDRDDDEVDKIIHDIKIVNDDEIEPLPIDKIYVPSFIKSEISRFIKCVEKNVGTLRFILSGSPGTAKTELLKYISTQLKGKTTCILVNSGDMRINSIFNLAHYLSPAVVFIDDIDFIARDRESYSASKTLAAFLQKLDGFIDFKQVSVLSTTNDKKLIDIAAKRPGRFDQIIDVSEIDEKDYMNLIKDKIEDDEDLLQYFDAEVVKKFKRYKVTGSFIANLVKQLRIYKKTSDKVDKEIVSQFIDNSYKGFYSDQNKTEEKLGFNHND